MSIVCYRPDFSFTYIEVCSLSKSLGSTHLPVISYANRYAFSYIAIYTWILFPICLFNHYKEYNSWLCCILYTLIYVQFSKNIFKFCYF
jgi:heme O synthase-like polyprenyltransferase